MPNYVTRYRIKPEGFEIKDDGYIHVENGGEIDIQDGAELQIEGVAIELQASVINALVQGVAGSYKLARGVHVTASATDTVVTGLWSVVAVVATLEDAPAAGCAFVATSIGDQAGAPAAGSFLLNTYKNDLNAADAFTKKVNWVAVGL